MAGESGLKGLDKLLKQLNELEDALSGKITEKALEQGAKVLKNQAVKNVRNSCSNTGELYKSIDIKIEDIDGEKAAVVYSNKEQAFFTEFGTGPVGEKNKPSNLPPEVANSLVYHQGGWGFKASNLTEAEAKMYGFTHKHKYNGEDYYFTMGQKPKPWFYPAVAETKERVNKTVKAAVRKGIKEALGK